MTWPIGQGRDFAGTYDIETGRMRLMGDDGKTTELIPLDVDALAAKNPMLDAAAIKEELSLVKEACRPFDFQAFREGHLTPVFFGSALRNFGVRDLIDSLASYAPPPRGQEADRRIVEAGEPKMTGFVFKIQANMDPNHRDRIAFARLCSGKLRRGMKAKLTRTGKPVTLSAPQFFFAQDRSIADEAYAGDVVGIPNHGTLRIGDTLTEGEDIVFRGVPSFAPELLRRIKLTDAMKAKKLREALQQMAEEGVVQLFLPIDGSGAIVGVVGALQLDVLKERLQVEYGLPIDYESTRFTLCRWVSADSSVELDRFIEAHLSGMASDLDGAPVFLATNAFSLQYEQDRWKAVRFTDVKDYQRQAEAA
jgi:peptide chain release factor 3